MQRYEFTVHEMFLEVALKSRVMAIVGSPSSKLRVDDSEAGVDEDEEDIEALGTGVPSSEATSDDRCNPPAAVVLDRESPATGARTHDEAIALSMNRRAWI